MSVEKYDYKFPDETNVTVELNEKQAENDEKQAKSSEEPYKIEIVDDTPEADRGKRPIQPSAVKKIQKELSDEEIADLDPRAIAKIKKADKLWHDARREKERVEREQQELLRLAQATMAENERLRRTIDAGAHEYAESIKNEANLAISVAEKELYDAYQLGEADKIVAAQKRLNDAQLREHRAKSFNPKAVAPQEFENEQRLDSSNQRFDNNRQQPQQPQQYHPRTQRWMDENEWFGKNRAMTALALAEHEDLVSEYGQFYSGTDEYFNKLDKAMRKRFPEQFEHADAEPDAPVARKVHKRQPSSVAPVSRSSNSKPKVINLTSTQAAIIKKFNINPERYIKQYLEQYPEEQ